MAKPHRGRAHELFTLQRGFSAEIRCYNQPAKGNVPSSGWLQIQLVLGSLPGGPSGPTPRPSAEIPDGCSWGHCFGSKSIYRHIPHPGTWHVRCNQSRQQAFLGACSTLTCVSAVGKARGWGDLKLNLQLPLITQATKFTGSPCPFELWCGIFHVQSCFSGEKQTFPFRFVGVFVE